MKKLAALFALAAVSIATPVFACPNTDKEHEQTVDKDKKQDTTKTADQPVQKKDDKTTAPAKDQKPVEKKPAAKG
jgi:hypothetical protein